MQPLFADKRTPGTGQGMEKALKRQRSIKRAPPEDHETKVQHETRVPAKVALLLTKAEEASRRREEQTPKSALKRPRATSSAASTPRDSARKAAAGGGNRAEGMMPPSAHRENQQLHTFGTAPYNRVVSGNGASGQQHNATGYKNSTLNRELSKGIVTKPGENSDAPPAKLRRTLSRTVFPQSQGESQVSTYTPSQEL